MIGRQLQQHRMLSSSVRVSSQPGRLHQFQLVSQKKGHIQFADHSSRHISVKMLLMSTSNELIIDQLRPTPNQPIGIVFVGPRRLRRRSDQIA